MNRAILAFTAIAYGLSIALSLVVGLTGGYESRFIGLAYLTMFLPAIAVWIVDATFHEGPRVRWDRFPARYLPVALFLIPGVLHAVALPLLVAVDGRVPWQDWLTPQADGLFHSPESRGWGVLTLHALVGRIALNAIVGLTVVSILATFEEIGWRAWLLPRFAEWMGPRRAAVATAVVWALWHVPFQLSGIQHIDGVSPVSLALVLPIGTMVAGLILGWLWLRTESLWLVALGHGALNNWGQYAFKFMKDAASANLPRQLAVDALAMGAGMAVLLVIGVALLWRHLPLRLTLGV